MNLEDEISVLISKDIEKEIDNGIMITIEQRSGWFKVEIPRFINREHSIDIMIWCEKIFPEGSYNNYGVTWLFKYKKHAEWFTLRWL